MTNTILFAPPGTLATLTCVAEEHFSEHKDVDQYDESELVDVQVIFDDRAMPCFFDQIGNRYAVGYDIYTDGYVPLQIQTIHGIMPKADSDG